MKELAAIALSMLLGACATTGLSPVGAPAPAASAETRSLFRYTRAANSHIRVDVDQASFSGDDGFIPTETNWVQLRLAIENVSGDTIRFSDVRQRLADGTVVASAQSAAELSRAPSMTGEAARTIGIGAAGMAASFLFPPAGIIAGLATVGGASSRADRMRHVVEEANRTALAPQRIAPGTRVAGNIFVPALSAHQASSSSMKLAASRTL